MATEEHAEFSASGSERWLRCPASIELSKKAPPQRESEYAAEGTRAHKLLEFLLKNRTKLGAALDTAKKTYPEDMVNHVMVAVDWILEEFNTEEYAELYSETKVDSSSFTCPDQFGTLDCAIVRKFGRLTVIDYKHGAGVSVDVVDDEGKLNSQLVYYALGILDQFRDDDFTEVELVIIQPRAFHESGDVIRRVVVPLQEIQDWIPVFKRGVRACKSGIPTYAAGKWCRWCPAATICPELKDNAMKQAQIVFSDKKGLQSLPELTAIKSIPNLGTMLEAADKLEDWIAKVREHACHVLEKGGEVKGWKLVQKRGTRKWKDANAVEKAWGDRAFAPRALLSPAQLEKNVKGSNEWVSKNTTVEVSGTTLVRADDRRAEVKPLERVFGKV